MTRGAIVIAAAIAGVWLGGCDTHTSIGGLHGSQGGAAGDGVGGAGGIDGVGGAVGGTGGIAGGGGAVTASCGAGGRPTGQPPKTLSFLGPVDYPTGAGAGQLALGDLNEDGKLDLAFLDETAGVRVMLNQGNGVLGSLSDHAAGVAPRALALGDINGDGRLDLVVLGFAGVGVLLNQGNAAFTPPVNYLTGGGSLALAVGDLNGDGRVDIAVLNSGTTLASDSGSVAVLLNTGGGSFAPGNYPVSAQSSSITIGDLNGDCRPDLVVAGLGLGVLMNDGNGGFKAAIGYATGTAPSSVAIADLNGDGKLDLVGADPVSVYVLFNYGNGTFTVPVGYDLTVGSTSLYPAATVSLALADLDGDGAVDVVAALSCCGLVVSLNHRDGTFGQSTPFPVVPYAFSISVGDLNGDGQNDVAVVSRSGGNLPGDAQSTLRVLLNGSH